jgi:hypothetical protein
MPPQDRPQTRQVPPLLASAFRPAAAVLVPELADMARPPRLTNRQDTLRRFGVRRAF